MKRRQQMICYGLITVFAFILYAMWAYHLPFDMTPDEEMRYQLPEWILQNGRLPIGDEPELRHYAWGFSYAYIPYFPSLIAVVFMKVASLFGATGDLLFIAARLVSSASGAATVFMMLLIGEMAFKRPETKFLFTVFVGFLPQFVFLSAYFNNDTFAVFCCSMMLYAWIRGVKDHWSIKTSAILGVAIGMCMITYYNAYGMILCSIIVYMVSIWQDEEIEKKRNTFFRRGFLIAGIALLIGGWFFVRNVIIHDGDFLGMNSMLACGELYAVDALKPSMRQTFYNQGLPVSAMLNDGRWKMWTTRSFFACFGFMQVWAHEDTYFWYYRILIVGAVCALISFREKKMRIIYLCCILATLIPIGLTIRYSYAVDYEPQGRYVMSCLPAMMFLVSTGYEKIAGLIAKLHNVLGVIFTFIVGAGWLYLFGFIFKSLIIPWCWGR